MPASGLQVAILSGCARPAVMSSGAAALQWNNVPHPCVLGSFVGPTCARVMYEASVPHAPLLKGDDGLLCWWLPDVWRIASSSEAGARCVWKNPLRRPTRASRAPAMVSNCRSCRSSLCTQYGTVWQDGGHCRGAGHTHATVSEREVHGNLTLRSYATL